MKQRRRSAPQLLAEVEPLFRREVDTFDGERHVGLRVDGRFPDRSVFAVAWLKGDEALAVARVYEADLDHAPAQAMQLVYLGGEDLELVRLVARKAEAVSKVLAESSRKRSRPSAPTRHAGTKVR